MMSSCADCCNNKDGLCDVCMLSSALPFGFRQVGEVMPACSFWNAVKVDVSKEGDLYIYRKDEVKPLIIYGWLPFP